MIASGGDSQFRESDRPHPRGNPVGLPAANCIQANRKQAYVGKKVTIEYEDDLDGGDIDAAVVDTVDFSYRGNDYTVVLTRENGAQFDADVARWIAAAKKARAREARETRKKKAPTARKIPTARKATTATNTTRPAQDRATKPARATAVPAAPRRGRKTAAVTVPADQNRAIRQWAVANGHTVSKRGRISAEVIDAFKAAH